MDCEYILKSKKSRTSLDLLPIGDTPVQKNLDNKDNTIVSQIQHKRITDATQTYRKCILVFKRSVFLFSQYSRSGWGRQTAAGGEQIEVVRKFFRNEQGEVVL